LSRVADSVFWMSRYLERAENVARSIDVNLNLTLDLGDSINEQWAPLVYPTGDHDVFEARNGKCTSLQGRGDFNTPHRPASANVQRIPWILTACCRHLRIPMHPAPRRRIKTALLKTP
jgi:uncharacterized alpha-E superfamily protein